jgi:hypothetical protein
MALTNAGPLPSIGLAFGSSTHTLLASAGSIALNPVDGGVTPGATLLTTRKVTASHGSFTHTGQDATLTKSSTLSFWFPAPLPSIGLLDFDTDGVINALRANITVNGQPVIFRTGYGMICSTGVITFSGPPSLSDVETIASRGSFAVSGQSATLNRTYTPLTASCGTFSVSGPQISMSRETPTAKVLDALTGTITLSGQSVTFPSVDFVLTAEVGTFTVSGQTATLPSRVWAQVTRDTGSWTIVIPSSSTWT